MRCLFIFFFCVMQKKEKQSQQSFWMRDAVTATTAQPIRM